MIKCIGDGHDREALQLNIGVSSLFGNSCEHRTLAAWRKVGGVDARETWALPE
jgi:hypothetical protein